MRRWLSAHPRLVWAGALGALVVAGVVLVWFQPQKLLIDERVDEELPAASSERPGVSPSSMGSGRGSPSVSDPTTGAEPPSSPAGPEVLSRADLRLISHHASGVASLVRLADGSSLIRFEDLDVQNGPDLRIYLSTASADGPPDALDDDFVDLGELKGNQGNQNYPIPDDVDLDRYRSVTIWCRRFSVGFAVAPIG